jgi:hypothetical protein
MRWKTLLAGLMAFTLVAAPLSAFAAAGPAQDQKPATKTPAKAAKHKKLTSKPARKLKKHKAATKTLTRQDTKKRTPARRLSAKHQPAKQQLTKQRPAKHHLVSHASKHQSKRLTVKPAAATASHTGPAKH